MRQYNDGERSDVFAATPDIEFIRWLLSVAASDMDLVVVIIDISVAFMHARSNEEIVVKVPKDIASKFGHWLLKAAINGTRRASQL